MNNFTKEELEGILLCISHGSWMYKAIKNKVINKIQSLIDNYCDHEFELEYTPHNCCTKCGLRR